MVFFYFSPSFTRINFWRFMSFLWMMRICLCKHAWLNIRCEHPPKRDTCLIFSSQLASYLQATRFDLMLWCKYCEWNLKVFGKSSYDVVMPSTTHLYHAAVMRSRSATADLGFKIMGFNLLIFFLFFFLFLSFSFPKSQYPNTFLLNTLPVHNRIPIQKWKHVKCFKTKAKFMLSNPYIIFVLCRSSVLY